MIAMIASVSIDMIFHSRFESLHSCPQAELPRNSFHNCSNRLASALRRVTQVTC